MKCIIPIPNFDESFAPFAVAKYVGYFKEEGFDVTFITVRGSNEAAMQISTGSADVAAASPVDEVIGAAARQGPRRKILLRPLLQEHLVALGV